MSQTNPGWYYADGDPPGTMRYWDGAQWVGEPTTQQPTYAGGGQVVQSDPLGYWKMGWSRWNDFSGRSRRAEYWWFALGNFLISIVFNILSAAADALVILVFVWALVGIVPGIAAGIRRLHDIGRSGWWLLIGLVPIIGAIVLLVWAFTDSDRSPNEWGSSPKYG